jgi:hypothetical protein
VKEQLEFADYLFGDLPAEQLNLLSAGLDDLLGRVRRQLEGSGTDDD